MRTSTFGWVLILCLNALWLSAATAEERTSANPRFHHSRYTDTFHLAHNPTEESTASTDKPIRVKKKLGRAILEFFAEMAVAQTNYWVRYIDWVEDWQFELTWEDQSKRFFSLEALRFDSNCFRINWTHGLAGSVYYNIARTNYLNQWESYIFAALGSIYWEYIVEWREVVSLNDNILNIFGGFPLGETWYQLGMFLHHSPKSFHKVLSFLNPLVKVNSWFDRKKAIPKPSPAGWHEFELYLGAQNAPAIESGLNSWRGFVGIDMGIIGIREYGREGEFDFKVPSGLLSEMHLSLAGGVDGAEQLELNVRAVYLGRFWQKLHDGNGQAGFFGLSSAFTLFTQKKVEFYDSCGVEYNDGQDLHLEQPRNFKDKYNIVHVAGPLLDWTLFANHLTTRITLNATLDFNLMNALALKKYSAEHDLSGTKTTLLYYGYYYGIGYSLAAGLTARYHNLELKAGISYHHADSIEGLDRVQESIIDDFHLSDWRLRYRIRLGIRFPDTPVKVLLSHDTTIGNGKIGDIENRERETRWTVGMGFLF